MSIQRGVHRRRRRIGLSTPTFFLETANENEIDEFISGPLSAIPPMSNPLDPTINATYLYNESKIFDFGHVMFQRESNGDVKLI